MTNTPGGWNAHYMIEVIRVPDKNYYWIKLQSDWFKTPAVKLLRTMAGGDTYAIIYLELILLSLENNGYIYFTGIGDNFSQEIALVLNEKEVDVEALMAYLISKKLIEYSDDNAFKFADDVTEGLIGKESSSAKRVRAYRNRQKQLALQSNNDVTDRNTELEKELEIDKDKREKHSAANATPLVQLKKDFEEIWQVYPNKKGKGQAFNHYKAWRKKSVDHTNEYLFNKLDRYKQYIKLNSNWYHPLNGATWFNGRFDDELDLTPQPQNRGYQKNTRKEIIPQWVKDQKSQHNANHGTSNHISDDDRKRLADRLAKLESKGG